MKQPSTFSCILVPNKYVDIADSAFVKVQASNVLVRTLSCSLDDQSEVKNEPTSFGR